MHRLFLAVAAVVIAVGIGCATTSPSPTAPPGPATTGNTAAPSPTATAELLPSVTPQEFFLSVSSPENEKVVDQATVEAQGRTVVDAVVTVNGQVVEVGPQGEFTASVDLEEGPNIIEVISSDFAGHEESRMISVIYIP